MEWTDEGIVLGTRRHGEANAILEVMTREHGRHLGLVRGGAASRLRPVLQPGNAVRAVWRARLDEHLGHYTVEPLQLHAASLLAASHVVYGVTHLARAVPAAAGARSASRRCTTGSRPCLTHLETPLAAGPRWCVSNCGCWRSSVSVSISSSCAATGDERGSGLCVAEIRARGVAVRRRALA